MRTGLWFARLEVLHSMLNSRRAWLTMFHPHPTSPLDPVACFKAGDSHGRPEVTNLWTSYATSAMTVWVYCILNGWTVATIVMPDVWTKRKELMPST